MTSTDLTIRDEQTYWTDLQVAGLHQLGVANAAPADLAVFFHYAVKSGLDPFARQIYMIERKSQGKTVQTIQTGIDGLRLIARRAADKSGGTFGEADILWCGDDGKWRDVWLAKESPAAAKAVVFRDGQPFSAVSLFSEYAGTKYGGELTSMWATKGALMLGKCAEASALRKAFPQDLSGLYASEEMAGPDEAPVVQPKRGGMAGLRDAVAPKHDEPVDADVVEDHPQTGGAAEPSAAANGEAPVPSPAAAPSPSVPEGDSSPSGTARDDLIPPGGKQMKALHASLNEAGLADRVAGLAFITDVLNRQVDSTKDLTVTEASHVLDELKSVIEDPFGSRPRDPS